MGRRRARGDCRGRRLRGRLLHPVRERPGRRGLCRGCSGCMEWHWSRGGSVRRLRARKQHREGKPAVKDYGHKPASIGAERSSTPRTERENSTQTLMSDPKTDPERMKKWEANTLPVPSAEEAKKSFGYIDHRDAHRDKDSGGDCPAAPCSDCKGSGAILIHGEVGSWEEPCPRCWDERQNGNCDAAAKRSASTDC
jgi:hypothetical protein